MTICHYSSDAYLYSHFFLPLTRSMPRESPVTHVGPFTPFDI